MIEFYGFNASHPAKTYQHGITTLGAFIDGLGVNRKAHFVQPIDIVVNGAHIPSCQWDATHILPHDDIKAYQTAPHGGIFKGLAGIIGGVLSFAFGWLTPSSGNIRSNTTPSGEKIEAAAVKANTPNLGGVVPEGFGRYRIYPDYVTMPRRYYADRRVQMLEFSACVGVGVYDFGQADIRIADTVIEGLPDATVNRYLPGESLAADPAHLNWHTAAEVGGTSSGTAGLELSTDLANRTNEDPPYYDFDGLNITRDSGSFPSGWGEGTTVRVSAPFAYEVADRNISIGIPMWVSSFTGWLGHLPFDGQYSSGIFSGYTPRLVDGSATGNGTVIFFRIEEDELGEETTIYLTGVPAGSRSYALGDLYVRTIASMSDTQITDSAYPYPPNTRTPGATVTLEGGEAYGEFSGPFAACPPGQKTDLIELDVLFPNGLNRLTDSGESRDQTVRIQVQYRDKAGGAWQTLTKAYTDATMDVLGFTEQIPVSQMEPVVRMRRIGASSQTNNVFDTVNWFGLKCQLPGRSVYPDWTTITASFQSGGKLAAQSENRINVIATRVLPELEDDGTWSAPRPTRQIAAACRYMWNSIGYTDADADMAEFLRLHLTYWKPRGETFDYVMSDGTVLDSINTALGAGMAVLTVDGGLIKPVRDERRTVGMEERKLSFSDLSTVGDISEDFSPWVPDDYDGCEVEFTDPVSFEPDTVRYILPGKPGIKIETIKAPGVTDRRRAWVIAARRVLANYYRRHRVSFRTEMSGFNARYWSFIAAISNDPLISQSAYILGARRDADGNLLLQSSETLQVEEGASYVAAYRSLEGKFIGPFAVDVNLIISGKTLVLPPAAPMPERISGAEPPHLYFGKAEEIEKSFLVEGVTFSSMKNADIKAVNYDDRVFSEDDNTPPEQ